MTTTNRNSLYKGFQMKFLNLRLDEELSLLVEKAKIDLCLNPSELARKLLKAELKHLLMNIK